MLDLIDELAKGTINKILEKDDMELAFEVLTKDYDVDVETLKFIINITEENGIEPFSKKGKSYFFNNTLLFILDMKFELFEFTDHQEKQFQIFDKTDKDFLECGEWRKLENTKYPDKEKYNYIFKEINSIYYNGWIIKELIENLKEFEVKPGYRNLKFRFKGGYGYLNTMNQERVTHELEVGLVKKYDNDLYIRDHETYYNNMDN